MASRAGYCFTTGGPVLKATNIPQGFNADFDAFIDLHARASARSASTFEEYVRSLPGILPDEALAALRRIDGEHAARLAADACVDRAGATLDQCRQLPLPHPLDSEFRFDEPTADMLARSLVDTTTWRRDTSHWSSNSRNRAGEDVG